MIWNAAIYCTRVERDPFVVALRCTLVYLFGSWNTRVGLTARQWIDGVNFERLEELKALAPNALKIVQSIDKKTFKKRRHEIFKPWIAPLIPAADSGRRLCIAPAK
jgi:hypothetical protein